MSLSFLFSFALGLLFFASLRDLYITSKFQKISKTKDTAYFDVLLENDIRVVYVKVYRRFNLEWLVTSKFFIRMGYVLRALLCLLAIIGFIGLIYLCNFTDYAEFFSTKL